MNEIILKQKKGGSTSKRQFYPISATVVCFLCSVCLVFLSTHLFHSSRREFRI